MALSQSVLTRKSASYRQHLYESMQRSASAGQVKSAFLCHSHRDETIVKGLIALFQERGVDLYIDWKDHTMPDTPNVETAKKIQDAIRGRDLFLFLATANSKASRWCPWEIGYADSSRRRIYIISTVDDSGTYGNEYLELYARIDEGSCGAQQGLAVFGAGMDKGEWLSVGNL